LAPRVLEAGNDPQTVRRALEDAWLNERVQRRWQHFALNLGEAATEALLERAAAAGLAGGRLVNHPAQQATDGWALTTGGHEGAVQRPPGVSSGQSMSGVAPGHRQCKPVRVPALRALSA